jgi:hypothetical protein
MLSRGYYSGKFEDERKQVISKTDGNIFQVEAIAVF